jgi:hypothetical protein
MADRYQPPREGEGYYGRDRRVEAESRVGGLVKRYKDDTTVRLFVKELLRNTRSPNKRPVYEKWLKEHPINE